MSLKETIERDLKEAMKARDTVRLSTLRSLRAAFLDKEISERKDGKAVLSDEQLLAVVQKQAKQRRDSIELYEQGERADLASAEKAELAIIETYLPAQLSEAEVQVVVERVIAQTGAETMADIGKVMGPAMGQLRGKADGKLVNLVVRKLLES